jgi:hypothetical protein
MGIGARGQREDHRTQQHGTKRQQADPDRRQTAGTQHNETFLSPSDALRRFAVVACGTLRGGVIGRPAADIAHRHRDWTFDRFVKLGWGASTNGSIASALPMTWIV